MTRRLIRYEWTAETLDEFDDITEVHFADTFDEIVETYRALPDPKRVGVLRRVAVTECPDDNWENDPTTDEESRDYAYFNDEGELPDTCDYGSPLPAHIRKHRLT